jgi:hypothetical protein
LLKDNFLRNRQFNADIINNENKLKNGRPFDSYKKVDRDLFNRKTKEFYQACIECGVSQEIINLYYVLTPEEDTKSLENYFTKQGIPK